MKKPTPKEPKDAGVRAFVNKARQMKDRANAYADEISELIASGAVNLTDAYYTPVKPLYHG